MKSAIRRGTTGGLALLLVAIQMALVPTAAAAGEQIVMLVPGIPGSSLVTGHSGWIDVSSFAGSAVGPSTTGAKQPCQMTVQKPIDMASPHLWVATVNATIFTTIKIDVLTTGAGATNFVLYEILLTEAQLTSIGDAGSAGVPLESIALKATSVTLTFNKQSVTGQITPITTTFTC